VKLSVGKATDEGRLRTNNEDSFLVDDDRYLYAVADGMGGHRGGEVASATAIEAVRAAFASGSLIADAISQANTAVITRATGNPDLDGMGTTLTAVTVSGPRELLIGHVGDSRAYLLHDGDLTRITDDHSLVEELVREGRLTPEQAESHPQRAIVTRALGIHDPIEVDLYRVGVDIGDRVVLCSDGLTTMVRERDVERIARSEDDPQRAAEALVAAANDAGGEDNITLLVIEVVEVDAEMPAATTPVGPAVITSAPEVEEPAPTKVKPPREKGSRLRTVRGAIFVLLPLVIVLGIAVAAIGWYARSSYYVGVANGEVVIFKGVPGGILGWNPTIDERTGIKVADLTQLERDQVNANTSRGSLGTAESVVARLEQSATAATSTTTTTKPRPTTTTTRPRSTTTTKP
jgi:PPM family protein phosphatase